MRMSSRKKWRTGVWAVATVALLGIPEVENDGASAASDPVSLVVTKSDDTDDGVCDADCSLREAVVAANADPADNVIDLPAGTYELTLDWWGAATHFGALEVESGAGTTTIVGAGRDTTIIDATTLRTVGVDNPDRVFVVRSGSGLELVGVTVTGGYTENALSAQRDGGGIWNWGGELTITDAIIEGNVAGGNGGGIASTGTTAITDSVIRDNNTDPPDYVTTGYGGGIWSTGLLTIIDSSVENNASDFGGGIANEGDAPGQLDMQSSTLSANSSRTAVAA